MHLCPRLWTEHGALLRVRGHMCLAPHNKHGLWVKALKILKVNLLTLRNPIPKLTWQGPLS